MDAREIGRLLAEAEAGVCVSAQTGLRQTSSFVLLE